MVVLLGQQYSTVPYSIVVQNPPMVVLLGQQYSTVQYHTV